jgi:hypothetical protein
LAKFQSRVDLDVSARLDFNSFSFLAALTKELIGQIIERGIGGTQSANLTLERLTGNPGFDSPHPNWTSNIHFALISSSTDDRFDLAADVSPTRKCSWFNFQFGRVIFILSGFPLSMIFSFFSVS